MGTLRLRDVARIGAAVAIALLCVAPAGAAAAGPPFPDPVGGQRVYDTAAIWTSATVAEADRLIRAIEDRTAAQVVVYSQVTDYGITGDDATAQAKALGTQWGVGRNGFNDGLVILFDIDPSRVHGQVAIVGGDGFRSAYIDDAASKRIIDEAIVPLLIGGAPDFNGALLAGLGRVDRETTPQRASDLQRTRLVNAVLGVIVAPLLGLLLISWALFHWLRYGRDPVYLDDPSILMPAPPAELTAAAGAVVYDGSSSRRALTTALLDLASRGELAFEESRALLKKKVGIRTHGVEPATEEDAARRRLNARKPLGDAERYALTELRGLSTSDTVLDDEELLKFGAKVGTFDQKLEAHVVAQGWFTQAPSRVKGRWTSLGIGEVVLGGIGLFIGIKVPISGLVVVSVAAIVGGGVSAIIGQAMPARTMAGATIRAMLAAYRRTLDQTMAQARSMQQVVDEAKLAWLETPDQALVWGVALGLQGQAEAVLERSADDLRAGTASPSMLWFPAWYGTSGSFSGATGAGGSSFSGSPIPDFGGMMGVLGSVGNSPSSSGGSGGGFSGGFSGGSSGGFCGGSSGGF
jgi:uncharacterized membrane protein YgcG